MSNIDTRIEYAIEVPNRGYMKSYGGIYATITQDPNQAGTFDDVGGAVQGLQSAKDRYTSMGCPEIAETLRIVKRTVTLTRSDWAFAEKAFTK